MYEAWMSGQDPSSLVRDYLNTIMPPLIQVSPSDPIYPPGFGPYANTSNVVGTSTVRPLRTPMMSNLLFVPTMPTNNVLQPIMVLKSNNDPPFKVPRDHGYTSEEALKISSSYPHTHNIVPLSKLIKLLRTRGDEEMTRKMNSLEQRVRDM
ncbi:hypothetical protein RDI58_024803 [Solanum bulbocastanum]|uniref:Uncharacterized protein n=1 Tax=Solanum bulbocastanum TaxID=147425 RepID=A0AAN8SYB1_SOLBU